MLHLGPKTCLLNSSPEYPSLTSTIYLRNDGWEAISFKLLCHESADLHVAVTADRGEIRPGEKVEISVIFHMPEYQRFGFEDRAVKISAVWTKARFVNTGSLKNCWWLKMGTEMLPFFPAVKSCNFCIKNQEVMETDMDTNSDGMVAHDSMVNSFSALDVGESSNQSVHPSIGCI